MENDTKEHVSKTTEQVDFIDILKYILKYKARVFRFMIVFFIIGVIVAFITPKEYTSTSIILPQISSNKGLSKKYSNIAALVGINLGQSDGNKIVPTLYPIIVEGAPFQKAILQKNINIEELENSITLYDYLQNYKKDGPLSILAQYTIGLPGKIIHSLKGESNNGVKTLDNTLYQYSKEEEIYIKYLEDHLTISFDENDGFILISATMDEPVLAAQLARNAQNLLQDFIIDYNITKASDELKFIEERLDEAKEEYIDRRAKLGDFRDRNKNGILSTSRNREEQLKAEYDLAYNIYSELSSQRESAKLQVEKDTPIFTELQPALVASEPSAPSKVKVILGFTIIGMLLAVAIIVTKFLSPVIRDFLKNSED